MPGARARASALMGQFRSRSKYVVRFALAAWHAARKKLSRAAAGLPPAGLSSGMASNHRCRNSTWPWFLNSHEMMPLYRLSGKRGGGGLRHKLKLFTAGGGPGSTNTRQGASVAGPGARSPGHECVAEALSIGQGQGQRQGGVPRDEEWFQGSRCCRNTASQA